MAETEKRETAKQQDGKSGKPKYGIWQNTAYLMAVAWRVCRQVLPLCGAIAVVTAGQTVAEMLIAPVILQQIESAVSWQELTAAILMFCAALLLLSALKGYLDENRQFHYTDIRVDLIRELGKKMAQTSYPNLLDPEFIAMENRASYSCMQKGAVDTIWDRWTEILTDGICFAIFLVLLSGRNPLLTGLIIVTAAVSNLSGRWCQRWDDRHREEKAVYDRRLDYICQVAARSQPAKDIRIFGLRDWLDDVWSDTVRLYQGFLLRRGKVYIRMTVADLLLTLLRNGAAYAWLVSLALAGRISASGFLLYFSAVGSLNRCMTGILEGVSELHTRSREISDIREVLEWPEPFGGNEGEPLPLNRNGSYEIRLEQVSYRYPGAREDTISHMDLTIRPGEKLAIVGLNGAGKTTLVRLICGFLNPTEGRVLLNGQDIRRYRRRDYYALFSSVFQDFSVLEHTIAVNVAQRVKGIDRERVWQCLELAGLTEKVRSLPQGIDTHIGKQVFEDGVELSGGQVQRLMLARAMYKDGAILLLDEPTAALDPIAENDVYMKYHEMARGKTSLFISHRLASTRFCDRILFLEHGQIREDGSHEALMAMGGSYAGLYETQSRYYQEGGDSGEET